MFFQRRSGGYPAGAFNFTPIRRNAMGKTGKHWVKPGNGWDATIYIMDTDGAPKANAKGKPMRKRGRPVAKTDSTPSPAGAGNGMAGDAVAASAETGKYLADYDRGQTLPEWKPGTSADAAGDGLPAPDTSPTVPGAVVNPAAPMIVGAFIGLGCMIAGDGFAPSSDAERTMLTDATGAYMDSIGATDLPPGMVLVAVVGMYITGKMSDPSVRETAVKRWRKVFPPKAPPAKPSAAGASETAPVAPMMAPAAPQQEAPTPSLPAADSDMGRLKGSVTFNPSQS